MNGSSGSFSAPHDGQESAKIGRWFSTKFSSSTNSGLVTGFVVIMKGD